MPRFHEKVRIVSDASGTGLGAVWEQEGHVVAYYAACRGLRTAEKHHSTVELECLAIVKSVKRFRHYLLRRQFEILTDHRPLEAGEAKECRTTMALGCNITGDDFVIRYRQGIDNENADALSRSSVICINSSW